MKQDESGWQTRSGAELADAFQRRLTWAAAIANTLGAIDVLGLLFILIAPNSHVSTAEVLLVNIVGGAIYIAATLTIGTIWARRRAASFTDWLRSDEPPGPKQRQQALHQPLDFAIVSVTFWGIAAVLFGLMNGMASESASLGALVMVTIALGGLSTGSVGYLAAERLIRPMTARALVGGPPERPHGPGVTARVVLAWAVATAVPLLGIVAVVVVKLAGGDMTWSRAGAAVLFLTAIALVVGLIALFFAARSVADPLDAVRKALARVEDGDFHARVAVADGSEVGLLQAGFNRMAAGLHERERLRDLFGRHVGEDVARAALDGEVALGGEEREVAALFVDLVGSTALAARQPPSQVVSLLNSFFAIVIDAVESHGGLVNKFEGDAALSIFGAPVAVPDPAGDCLAAAREMRARLTRELPDVDFGIGVSAGVAVAGNVGSEQRFEYTVIGDPINEAARLCELAKQHPERVLASVAALERARPEEAARWDVGETVSLRGRGAPTQLATAAR